jgi:hypothetical protein
MLFLEAIWFALGFVFPWRQKLQANGKNDYYQLTEGAFYVGGFCKRACRRDHPATCDLFVVKAREVEQAARSVARGV